VTGVGRLPVRDAREAGCRVLVADDHPALRGAIRDALESEGYAVDEAADGRRALDALRADAHRVAVTDVRMPGLNGLELLEQVSELGLACRVILVSVLADPETVRRADEMGAFAFHQKPFRLDALLADVRAACA
jgi:DNA-binding NtrC family response regulator